MAPDALAIVQHLLDNGANPLQCNRHDDNVLQYAAQHTGSAAIFSALLKHLETVENLKQPGALLAVLSAVNHDGLAIIHLIVRNRKFDFMVALLSTIDRCLMRTMVATPMELDGPTNTMATTLAALRRQIDSFDQDTNGVGPAMDPRKAALLNQRDPRTGRTALLLAMLQRDAEAMVLLLLAHHADPRLPDLAGVECATACLGFGDKDDIVAGGNIRGMASTMVYVQKAWNFLQHMDGDRPRLRTTMRPRVRETIDSDGDGGSQMDGLALLSSSAENRISGVDHMSVQDITTQRPKRPYKKRKTYSKSEIKN